MKKTRVAAALLFFFVVAVLVGPAIAGFPLAQGKITGTIEKANEAFLRDYERLDYQGQKKWEHWGKGLKALGWIVVRGNSGGSKGLLLFVIDTRTEMKSNDSEKSPFAGLQPGTRIEAKYRMGWDAFHAVYVKKLGK